MSSFTGNFDTRGLGLTDNVMLLDDIGYYSEKYKVIVIMRARFITDLDSIPQCLKSVVRASPVRAFRAYALHDGLYRQGYDKKLSDLLLDEALEVVEINWYARTKVYAGLWMFGKPTNDEDLIMNAIERVEIYDVKEYDVKKYKEICSDYLKK